MTTTNYFLFSENKFAFFEFIPNFQVWALLPMQGTHKSIINNCHTLIIPRVVARVKQVGFESFEARTWQLFICKRWPPYAKWQMQYL